MDGSGRRFNRWRIVLGIFRSILLFGFSEPKRCVLRVRNSLANLLVVAWTILMIFLRHVISTGTWDFNAIH